VTSTEPPGADLFVEIVTYTIYAAWLAAVTAGALYISIPPLPSIQNTYGTAAAIAAGVAFFAIARVLYDTIRRRISPKAEPEPEPELELETSALPEPAPNKQRKRSKKKRRS
jgi:hypothetical protein